MLLKQWKICTFISHTCHNYTIAIVPPSQDAFEFYFADNLGTWDDHSTTKNKDPLQGEVISAHLNFVIGATTVACSATNFGIHVPTLTRALLGKANGSPTLFPKIYPKLKQMTRNLPYFSGQQFHTLCQKKIGSDGIIGQPLVTSE